MFDGFCSEQTSRNGVGYRNQGEKMRRHRACDDTFSTFSFRLWLFFLSSPINGTAITSFVSSFDFSTVYTLCISDTTLRHIADTLPVRVIIDLVSHFSSTNPWLYSPKNSNQLFFHSRKDIRHIAPLHSFKKFSFQEKGKNFFLIFKQKIID